VRNDHYSLPPRLWSRVAAVLAEWERSGKLARLWAGDSSLWTGGDEKSWLGWLDIVKDQLMNLEPLLDFSAEVRRSKFFRHALVMGMGGSSLFPEVLARSFGSSEQYPRMLVLDSTVPAQVKAFEDKIDFDHTLFIVSSKSGTTLEPNIFMRYFLQRAKESVGAAEAPHRFIAITDPGSQLHRVAEAEGFRHIFFGVPTIGGRYSALSNFGMVPAATMGLDIRKLLSRAQEMVDSCSANVAPKENPGVLLGAVLGALGKEGQDKVTLIASPGIGGFGAWLEQLLAESTGKNGIGLIPVDGEKLASPDVYGEDRLFVYLRLASSPDAEQDRVVDLLTKAEESVVTLTLRDTFDIGSEVFRWEMATAVAGAVLGINPFDQPDVEASKIATRELTQQFEKTGALPQEAPLFEVDGIQLFADAHLASALPRRGSLGGLAGILKAHLDRSSVGDYFALLAYLPMTDAIERRLQSIRHAVRDARRLATCLGFGPRFLHSTGQAYKGGPNEGVFIQITSDDPIDLPVPGQKYSFGVVKTAQARGDFRVLVERGRRALHVHLGRNLEADLTTFERAMAEALK
jgi:transaldolase/glucose-6-phosphate isomerase